MLLKSKLPFCHREGHVELTCQEFRRYWQELAEDIIAVDVPRKVVCIKISFFVIKIGVSFYLLNFVLFKDLRYDFLRVIIK